MAGIVTRPAGADEITDGDAELALTKLVDLFDSLGLEVESLSVTIK